MGLHPAFNAGEPRFIFYPPLSWTLGALLGLLLPWTLVPAAFIWIALTLAGLTFRRLALPYTTPASATLGATLYLANPYMLFTAFERSAFAELLAAALLPLLLAAILPRPLDTATTPRRILRIAIPLGLIWLTNAPAAVMFTYALAFLALLRLLTSTRPASRFPLALTTTGGTLLGLALAAIYIVPAAFERRFVQIQMVIMEGMRVDDHFLFHRMSGHTPDDLFHNDVVRTASLIALTLLAAIALAAFAALRRQLALQTPSAPSLLLPLLTLAAVVAFLLLPVSLPLWHHLPQLAFLQFPWRLSALLGAIFALLVTLALPRIPSSPRVLYPLLAALVLTLPAWFLFHQSCDLEDSIPARVALYHSPLGTEATDEYTPPTPIQTPSHPTIPPTGSSPPRPPAQPRTPPPHRPVHPLPALSHRARLPPILSYACPSPVT